MIRASIFSLTVLFVFCGKVLAQQGIDSRQTEGGATNRNLTKGTFTFSLNGSAHNDRHIAGWSLTPQAGYMVTDRLVAGLQLSVTNRFIKEKKSWLNFKRTDVREYAVTPEIYARYYVLPFRFTPFVQWSSGYNFGEFTSNTFTGQKQSINTNNFVMFGALGLSLRAGKNVGLQALYNLPLIADSNVNDMIRGNRFRLGLSFYLR